MVSGSVDFIGKKGEETMKKIGSIYIIKNYVNNKVYVGQTTMTVRERFMTHLKPSVSKMRRSYKLYNAIEKYGRDKFYVEVLEENVSLERIDEIEIYYIALYDSYNNGYNSTKGGDGRVINIIENENELLELAQKGRRASELAKKYDVHPATIYRTIHKLNFYYNYEKIDEEILFKLIDQKKSNKYIAEYFGVSTATVSRRLEKLNVKKYNKKVKFREDINIEELIDDYKNQVSINDICKKYNVTKTTLSRIRKNNNILSRKQVYKRKEFSSAEYDIEGITNDFKQHITKSNICKKYNISSSTLERILLQEKLEKNIRKSEVQLPEKEICEMIMTDYYAYMTIQKICLKYNISTYRFEQIKKGLNFGRRKRKYVQEEKKYDGFKYEELIDAYVSDIGVEKICKKYEISLPKLYEVLSYYNIKKRSELANCSYEERYDVAAMFKDYYNDLPIAEISKRYKISTGIFYRIMKKRGMPKKKKKVIHE